MCLKNVRVMKPSSFDMTNNNQVNAVVQMQGQMYPVTCNTICKGNGISVNKQKQQGSSGWS